MLGKTVWVIPASVKGKPICVISFSQAPVRTWWVMREDGEVQRVPQRDLIWGEGSQLINLYSIDFYITLYIITAVVTIGPSPHWEPCGIWLCHYTFGDLN